MDKLNPPKKLNFSGNISQRWKLWKQGIISYITDAEKTKKSDEVKSSILLTCIGQRGRELHNTFVFGNESMKMNFNYILQKFDDYWSPQKKCDFRPMQIFSYKQSEGQCFDNFVAEAEVEEAQ